VLKINLLMVLKKSGGGTPVDKSQHSLDPEKRTETTVRAEEHWRA